MIESNHIVETYNARRDRQGTLAHRSARSPISSEQPGPLRKFPPLFPTMTIALFLVTLTLRLLTATASGQLRNGSDPPIAEALPLPGGMTLERAVTCPGAPAAVTRTMVAVTVPYIDMNGVRQRGVLVVHRGLAREVEAIFGEIADSGFRIERIEPVAAYGWSDTRSMAANNTSGYNYRIVEGTRHLSRHARGCAIDINPALNPWIRNGRNYPPRPYRPGTAGTITRSSAIVRIFARYGWRWGGTFRRNPDFQHFEHPTPS